MFGKGDFCQGTLHRKVGCDGEAWRNNSPPCGREAPSGQGLATPESVWQRELWDRVRTGEGFASVLRASCKEIAPKPIQIIMIYSLCRRALSCSFIHYLI